MTRGKPNDSPSSAAGFLVSATHSGAGKTTVTGILMRALRARGLEIQPFKVGPDFVDTAHHAAACGCPSINLDLWMMGTDGVKGAYGRLAPGADISVVEAMGGLYDGTDGTDEGSGAHVAKLLDLPVVVVVDAWGMTRTSAAILSGLIEFDRRVVIAGFIFNRVGSVRHARMIESALPLGLRSKVVGFVLQRSELAISERHLGLTAVQELGSTRASRERAQEHAEEHLNIDLLIRSTIGSVRRGAGPAVAVSRPPVRAARLGIARDSAFHFYYEENLRLLQEVGFELVEFRPIADEQLPPDVDAVYLGGGYPESYVSELEANERLAADLRRRADGGMPVYAECGGYIYLGRSLTGLDGVRRKMSGVLPIDFSMDPAHLAIAYVHLHTRVGSVLGPPGTTMRGQVFHQSRIVKSELEANLYEVQTSDRRDYREGHSKGSVTGSYAHLHFGSRPDAVSSFLLAAQAHRADRQIPQPEGKNHHDVSPI